MTDQHPGSRACYQAGCRALECRVANAVYMAVYRARIRQGKAMSRSVVKGYEASRLLQGLSCEGYWPSMLALVLGVSKWTISRHGRSRRCQRRTLLCVRAFCRRVAISSHDELTANQRNHAVQMLRTLGLERFNPEVWQDLAHRDDDA